MKANLKQAILDLSKPILILTASRIVVLLGIAFSSFLPHNPGLPEDWAYSFVNPFMRWDAGWYRGIAESGYVLTPEGNIPNSVEFFPMYTIVSMIIHKFLGISIPWSMFIVSNLSFFAGIIILYLYVKECYGEDCAIWTVFFLCFLPQSVFFSVGYTESIAFLFTIASFYCIQKERFLTASVLIGLASATKFTMVALILPFLWTLVKNRRYSKNYLLIMAFLALSVSGLASYMFFLWYKFSDFFAFGNVLGRWQTRHYSFLDSISMSVVYKESAASIGSANVYSFHATLIHLFGILLFLSFLISSIYGLIRFKQPLFLFSIVLLLLSYFGVASKMGLVSIGRYSMLAFPAIIIIASFNNFLKIIILAFFSSLLPIYAALFAKWYWIG